MNVRYSYLKDKFPREVFNKITEKMWTDVVSSGDFTLGKAVGEFEKNFAELMGVKYAVGVANGTDALELSLYLAGVRAWDEVIAPANTFVASLGAIGNLQAEPILVDIGHDYVMDVDKVEEKITAKTKAILPVHFCGNPVDMEKLMKLSEKYNIPVIEDACQAYLAEFNGKCVGGFGLAGAFSLHPLKILNVMGDGGMVTTNDDKFHRELKLLQNHGLYNRDTITRFPCRNSRLDSIHAVVGNFQIHDTPKNVKARRANAKYFDDNLKGFVYTIPRDPDFNSCFHLYFFEVEPGVRDHLHKYLLDSGIDAKIHYKVPLYQQDGLRSLGYAPGSFPESDRVCSRIITLPTDEHMTKEMMDYCILKVREFMSEKANNL